MINLEFIENQIFREDHYGPPLRFYGCFFAYFF